jgi:hypothetical protein
LKARGFDRKIFREKLHRNQWQRFFAEQQGARNNRASKKTPMTTNSFQKRCQSRENSATRLN